MFLITKQNSSLRMHEYGIELCGGFGIMAVWGFALVLMVMVEMWCICLLLYTYVSGIGKSVSGSVLGIVMIRSGK